MPTPADPTFILVRDLNKLSASDPAVEENNDYPVRRLSMKYPRISWEIGPSDFDALMSSIKFWKGDDNLRPVYKKTVFRNIEVACILDFLAHRKYTLTPYELKLF
jgi:hypothetical protein